MSASACFRVLLDLSQDKLSKLEAISPLVARAADAFLAERWPTPRRYVVLTPFCFLLTDPDVDVLDAGQLQAMAGELKAQLFGASTMGDVTLLLHQGSEEEASQFAAVDEETLKRLLSLGGELPFGGRLQVMNTRSEGEGEGGMQWQPIDLSPARKSHGAVRWTPSYDGVYFVQGQRFEGSGVSACSAALGFPNGVFASAKALPHEADQLAFDMACVGAASEVLERTGHGKLFVPIAFAALMRPALKEAYLTAFEILPPGSKARLVAVLYGTPLIPSLRAFGEIRPMLGSAFGQVEIQVDDPSFNAQQLPQEGIGILTLRLPDLDPISRARSVRRFMDNIQGLTRRKIRMALTNVQSLDDIRLAAAKEIGLVSGPAVGGGWAAPAGLEPCGLHALPRRGAPVVHDARAAG